MIEPNHVIANNIAMDNNDAQELVNSYTPVPLTVDCVIFGFNQNSLKVLLIKSDLKEYQDKF